MRCLKCGYENISNYRFCNNCGSKLEKNKKGLGIASMIIGIITLILSFILSIFILPISITGLILGIVCNTKCGQKVAGIILNSISIITSILMFFVIMFFSALATLNPIQGNFDCTSVTDSKDYLITINFNKDKTFLYGPYNDLENNHIKGTYTYKDLKKTNYSKQYKYYEITLTPDVKESISNNEKIYADDKNYTFKAEMGITKDKTNKKQGALIFYSTYNTYYCYQK